MESIKYVYENVPKFFKWAIPSLLVVPLLVYIIQQFFTAQPLELSFRNVIILFVLTLLIMNIAFIWGAYVSLKRLLNKRNNKIELQKLPYNKITIGELKYEKINVEIVASIVLNEVLKPDVSIFLERIIINKPYCPKCLIPLEDWEERNITHYKFNGYKCMKCKTKIDCDEFYLLGLAESDVRKNYDKYWDIYRKTIDELTKGEPGKYKVP